MLPKILCPFYVNKKDLIRIGPKKDGGYIIHKNFLKKVDLIVSCGLSDDWNFEKDFLKRNKDCIVHAYDHTLNKKFWIKKLKKDLLNLLLLKGFKPRNVISMLKFLQYKLFFKSKNKHYLKRIGNGKNGSIRIKDIINFKKNYKKLLLKVDIEGDEYKILNDIILCSNKIYGVIIEFHNVHLKMNIIKSFIKRAKNFSIIHIHGNNFENLDDNNDPKCIEITLINKKYLSIKKRRNFNKYPIYGLDYPNLKRKKDIDLRFE